MSGGLPLSFADAGLVTAVGGCYEQTATSIRAGISRLNLAWDHGEDSNDLLFCARVEDGFLPALTSKLTQVLADSPRTVRCLQLAQLALQDLAVDALDDVPLFLALPEPSEGLEPLLNDFPDMLEQQTGLRFSATHRQVYAYGQAGGLAAFHGARSLIEAGSAPRVLLGGVDSRSQARSLACFRAQDRALRLEQAHGYVPGEGAGFLLIEAAGADSEVLIHEPGFAQQAPDAAETKPADPGQGSEAPGTALGKAMAAAARNAGGDTVATLISPLTGQVDQTNEWGDACTHLADHISMTPFLTHPCHLFGDLGAALAPVSVALAAHGIKGSYLPAPVMVCSISDGGQRAAALVTSSADKA
ncbi:MAG: beta-ketoacyl synthase N-terminal-like domain-containing protein [Xanthomonadales bacterium]|nr:beta-ketoacyl synthase N-terminal-like domain-containing protein [Xanthomonadales bacterium]